MKKMTALLTALLLCAMCFAPALAEVDLTANLTDDDLSFEEGSLTDDEGSEWLYEDDEYSDEFDLSDEELEALFEGMDDEPLSQINEADQEDLAAAMEIYSWFALQPLDHDEDFPSDDGTKWRVLDERFNTPELIQAALRSYFSAEIADSLWNSSANPYTVIDDHLYTDGEGREIDPNIGETVVEVTDRTEDTVRLTSTVEYFEPVGDQSSESFEFERKLIDGNWKYTVFPFYW